MRARTIVFHGDAFEVEITKQDEFMFHIDDGHATAADILSRKDAAALVEWLKHHLASSPGDAHD